MNTQTLNLLQKRNIRFKQLIKAKFVLMSLGLLPGCAGSNHQSHFDCPPGLGVGCTSTSRVNQMVSRGEIDLDDSPANKVSPHNQIFVYYGPNQLSRMITVNKMESR